MDCERKVILVTQPDTASMCFHHLDALAERCRENVQTRARCIRTCALLACITAKHLEHELPPLRPVPRALSSPTVPPAVPMARSASCQRFMDQNINQPRYAPRKARYLQAMAQAAQRPKPTKRKVWDGIVFGFELPMLQLHMQTLFSTVAGFLVTEADSCFQTRKSKRPVLTDALTNGSLPEFMATKTHVRVVTQREATAYFRKGTDLKCSRQRVTVTHGFSGRCFQTFQRYALMQMAVQRAAVDDLILISDVDEIAKPHLVQSMVDCDVFDGFDSEREHAKPEVGSMYVMTARQYKYGLHCTTGLSWADGPRMYTMKYISWAVAVNMSASNFDLLRNAYGFGAPQLRNSGWHLTSFGSVDELLRKLTTFGAANMFTERSALDPERLEACASQCIELLYPDRKIKETPQCHRFDPRNRTAWPATAYLPRLKGKRLASLDADVDLPEPLFTHHASFPSSWFRFLQRRALPVPPTATAARAKRYISVF